MRNKYFYRIEKEKQVLEFEKLVEVADYIGCVPSTISIYIKQNKPYDGWTITRTTIGKYTQPQNEKVIYNPRNRHSGKNNWKYYKYSCMGNEIICCEKTYFIDNKTIQYDLEDFLSIKELMIKGISLIFEDYFHSKYIKIPEISLNRSVNKAVEKRMVNIQVYVAWRESKRMIEQVNEIEDKILLIDKIVEEYEKRKRSGDNPNYWN